MNERNHYVFRVVVSLIISLFSFIGLSREGSAQSNSTELVMQVAPAFEGTVKNGEWLPIWVEVENQGPDVETEIHVKVKNRTGTTTYAAALSLPTNSRKRTPVYVRPNTYSREMIVHLIDKTSTAGSNQPLLEEKISVTSIINDSLLVGLLATERGPLSAIQDVAFDDNQRQKVLIDTGIAELPLKAEALRSFDVLIINDVDSSTFSTEQGMALEQWVRKGGHLILGGGSNTGRTLAGLPLNLRPRLMDVPIEIEQVDELATYAAQVGSRSESRGDDENGDKAAEVEAIKVTGPFVVHPAYFDEGTILVGDSDAPLIVERTLGLGTVQYVALSLTGSPFNAWAGNPNFWRTLLDPHAIFPAWLPRDVPQEQMRSSQMSMALGRLPSLNLPSIRGLGILLSIYILLVGPVNYLLLRWFRRLHWGWVTIPLLTVAFSAGSFSLGYAMRGTDLILNHIAVVEPAADGTGRVSNYMGLFSPAEQAYEIEIDGDNLISPMSQQNDGMFMGPMGSQPEASGDMTILNGTPGQIRSLAINQWSMQSFQTEDTWQNFGGVVGELRLTETQLEGEVRNELRHSLEDVVVILGQQFERLGDLEAGDTVSVSFDLDQTNRNRSGGHLWWKIYGNRSGGAPGPSLRQNELKRLIAEAVYPNRVHHPNGGIIPTGQGLLLLGWLSEMPINVRITDRTPVHQTTALVHTQIPIILPESGKITIPQGFINVQTIEHPSQGGSCDTPNSLHLQAGNAVLQFELPTERAFERIESLKLHANAGGSNEQVPVTIAFYKWDEEGWLDVDESTTGIYEIEQAEALVNPEGRIHVRIMAKHSFHSCGYFDLSVTGEL